MPTELTIELGVESSDCAAVAVRLSGLAWSLHFERFVLAWPPSRNRRRYSDHVGIFETVPELLPSEEGVLTLSVVPSSLASVGACVDELLESQQLPAETVVRASEQEGVVDWTDGVTNIATKYVDVGGQAILELEYRQVSTSPRRWDPLSLASDRSLFARVLGVSVAGPSRWPPGLVAQQVWE